MLLSKQQFIDIQRSYNDTFNGGADIYSMRRAMRICANNIPVLLYHIRAQAEALNKAHAALDQAHYVIDTACSGAAPVSAAKMARRCIEGIIGPREHNHNDAPDDAAQDEALAQKVAEWTQAAPSTPGTYGIIRKDKTATLHHYFVPPDAEDCADMAYWLGPLPSVFGILCDMGKESSCTS